MIGWHGACFRKEVMLSFGFHSFFVKLVMDCSETPSFLVLINGSPTCWFIFIVGVHQGDLLMPYLFIIEVEVLAHSIEREQSNCAL